MTDVKVRLPTYTERPLMASGQWSTPWFQFFTNLYARVGGATDLVSTGAALNELTTNGGIERLGQDLYTTYLLTPVGKTLAGSVTQAAARIYLGAAPIDSPAFTTAIGFNGSAAIAKPTITGSRGGNVALASLLTALDTYGLITDSTSA